MLISKLERIKEVLEKVLVNLANEDNKLAAFKGYIARKKEASRRKVFPEDKLQQEAKKYLENIVNAEKKTWDSLQKLWRLIKTISDDNIKEQLKHHWETIKKRNNDLLSSTEKDLPHEVDRKKWAVLDVTLFQKQLFELEEQINIIILFVDELNSALQQLKEYILSQIEILKNLRINVQVPLGLESFLKAQKVPLANAVALVDANFVADARRVHPGKKLDFPTVKKGYIPSIGELSKPGGDNNTALVPRKDLYALLSVSGFTAKFPRVDPSQVDPNIMKIIMDAWRRTNDSAKGITAEKFQNSVDFQIIYYCYMHPKEDKVVFTADYNLKQIIKDIGVKNVRFVGLHQGVLRAS